MLHVGRNAMRWLFAALLILVAAIAAQGELITHSTGSGGSVVVGSGVVVGGSNGCVLFKATTAKIGCNSTFTSNDAGTQLVIPNTVTNGAAANLAITATAELRLASNGGSVMRYNGDGHFFASAAGAYGSGLEIASTNNIFWVDNSGSAFAGRSDTVKSKPGSLPGAGSG